MDNRPECPHPSRPTSLQDSASCFPWIRLGSLGFDNASGCICDALTGRGHRGPPSRIEARCRGRATNTKPRGRSSALLPPHRRVSSWSASAATITGLCPGAVVPRGRLVSVAACCPRLSCTHARSRRVGKPAGAGLCNPVLRCSRNSFAVRFSSARPPMMTGTSRRPTRKLTWLVQAQFCGSPFSRQVRWRRLGRRRCAC
jgi:hypothetical protein